MVMFDDDNLSEDDSLSKSSKCSYEMESKGQTSGVVSKSSEAIKVHIKSFSKSPIPSPSLDNRLYKNRLTKLHFTDHKPSPIRQSSSKNSVSFIV